jgi:hypothetical protein
VAWVAEPPGGTAEWGPLTFDDPIFANVSEHPNLTMNVSNGATVSDYSITGRHSSLSANFHCGNCTLNRIRADVIDDVIRLEGGTVVVRDSFLKANGNAANEDHADIIQSWSSGYYVLDVARTMFWGEDQAGGGINGLSAANDLPGTGIRHGDEGRITLLKLDHVYFKSGHTGLAAHTPDTTWAGMHIWLDHVCFQGPWFSAATEIDTWAGGTITVDHWADVYNNCSIANGEVVLGTPMTCSANVEAIQGGSVVGCPD